jgi:GNAT superfamily N-acetyltransferase
MSSETITTRELEPSMWRDLERLFGASGACAGCWCMFWRLDRGERFDDIKGATAKRRFKALVERGKAHGVLAYAGDEPVGWCAFERRRELLRLDRAPSLRVDDADEVWSLPCFFVARGWRNRGVAGALLAAAENALRRRGAAIAEGYPSKLRPGRKARLPAKPAGRPDAAPRSTSSTAAAAFIYTGVPSMFEAAGFALAAARPTGKQRYRKALTRRRSGR